MRRLLSISSAVLLAALCGAPAAAHLMQPFEKVLLPPSPSRVRRRGAFRTKGARYGSNGYRETARRRQQIELGRLTASNGLVEAPTA